MNNIVNNFYLLQTGIIILFSQTMWYYVNAIARCVTSLLSKLSLHNLHRVGEWGRVSSLRQSYPNLTDTEVPLVDETE